MGSTESATPTAKRGYYGDPSVVKRYHWLRYGGAAGRRIFRRERAMARSLLAPLPKGRRGLDLACGIGRAAPWIRARAGFCVGLDRSPEMLRRARRRYDAVVLGDAARLPFRSDAFDLCVSLRFWFHLPDPRRVAASVARILAPGGSWILEGYCRSLTLVPGRAWGGRNFHAAPEAAARLLAESGFREADRRTDFLLPPSLLRWLGPLERIEAALSRRLGAGFHQDWHLRATRIR